MDLLQMHNIDCPYCGESVVLEIDCSIPSQEYIEDCQVCCRPINLIVNIEDNIVQINAFNENE